MSLWRDLIEARTPEEAARRRFGLWALGGMIVLLPLWWWIGADLVAGLLRPLVGLVARLFGLTGEIRVADDGAWLLGTRLHLQDGRAYAQAISAENVKRLMVGFPIYFAFLIAPPRTDRWLRAVGVGVLALIVVYLLSVVAVAWGQIAPLLNPALLVEREALRLMEPPLHPMMAQIALIGRYIGLTVGPLLTAIVVWAIVNPAGRNALLGGLAEDEADGGAPAA